MGSRCSQISGSRAEIEVGRNPPRPVSRKGTKKSPVAVQHLCPNLGVDRVVRRPSCRASSALRTQITFSLTFFGIHSYVWRVDRFPIEPKGSPNRMTAIAIGCYPTRTNRDLARRFKGFTNCKRNPAYQVIVEYRSDSKWDSDALRLDIPASDAILSSRTLTAQKHPSNCTNPERDWSGVLLEFARGKDAARLARKLTSRHADKQSSAYHSPRTVDVASTRTRLGKSIPIDDVFTLIELGIALRFYWHSAVLVRWSPQSIGGRCGRASYVQFRVGARTVLRTGRIVTLHP